MVAKDKRKQDTDESTRWVKTRGRRKARDKQKGEKDGCKREVKTRQNKYWRKAKKKKGCAKARNIKTRDKRHNKMKGRVRQIHVIIEIERKIATR